MIVCHVLENVRTPHEIKGIVCEAHVADVFLVHDGRQEEISRVVVIRPGRQPLGHARLGREVQHLSQARGETLGEQHVSEPMSFLRLAAGTRRIEPEKRTLVRGQELKSRPVAHRTLARVLEVEPGDDGSIRPARDGIQ